ncbi:MAG: nucleotidyltransferase domain-containing protein [Bacillota bacterium]
MRINQLISICRKYHVALLYLFGSQQKTGLALLKGENVSVDNPLTDVDIGVVFAKELPSPYERARLYAHVYNDLTDLFLPFRTDLCFLQENHSVFQLEAVARGICIYAADETFQEEYEMSVLRRGADFRWVLDKFYEEKLADY